MFSEDMHVGTDIRCRLVHSNTGMGSFLDPPNSPKKQYEVHIWYRPHRTREADAMLSLEGALKDPDVPESIKQRIRELYANANMQPTEEWLSKVYGYFKNCYSPDGVKRSVANCLIVKPNPKYSEESAVDDVPYVQAEKRYVVGTFGRDGQLDELPPIETSLAVMHVRQFFPDHEPRPDLLETGRWGNEQTGGGS